MGMEVDWLGILEKETGKKWQDAHGPDSGVGVDYWYAVVGEEEFAYLNIDQDFITLAIQPEDEDEEPKTLFEGTYDDLAEHPELASFVTEAPSPA